MKTSIDRIIVPLTSALTAGMCCGSIIIGTVFTILCIVCFSAFQRFDRPVLRYLLYAGTSILVIAAKIMLHSPLYAAFTAVAAVVAALTYCKLTYPATGRQRFGELLLILNPLSALFLMELLNSKSSRLLFTICYLQEFPLLQGYYFLGFLCAYVLLALLFFSTRYLFGDRIGCILAGSTVLIFSIVNHTVLSITGQPFLPSDLQIAGTAFGVLQAQALTSASILRITAAMLGFGFYIAAILYFVPKQTQMNLRQRIRRAICGVQAAYAIVVIGICISWGKETILLYNGHQKYSAVINFILNLDYKIPFPDDVTDYLPSPDTDSESDFKPNIIVVMNEAFSDLTDALELETNTDPIPYFRSLCAAYTSGITYSSVLGNNTCSSEWEFLSGTSTALTRKGSIVYSDNCRPMQSIVSALNARGYTTAALHPYLGNGYNRKAVYEALGFQKMYFADDLPVTSADKIRDFASDQYCYETLIDLFEQNNEEPFFAFCITMQNHADYLSDGGITPKITAGNVVGTEYEEKLNRYLTLLGESDRALQTLFSYFELVEEPTVILFFGDHQPQLDRSIYTDHFGGESFYEMDLMDLTHAYEIPYLIWSNYEIGTAPEVTSMNYLSSVLFETAGIEPTAWMERMENYRSDLPVLTEQFYSTADGEFHMFNTNTAAAVSVLAEYQKYCYGILYGN